MSYLNRRVVRSLTPLATLAFAGCMVGPNYKTPDAPTVSQYRAGAAAAAAAPVSEVPAQWWTWLNAPELDQTIREALRSNPTLASQRARLMAAQELTGASDADLYPHVDADASAGRQKYGAAFLGPQKLPPFTFYSVGLSVSYAFDIAGGMHRALEQQRAATEAQQDEIDAATLSLSGNVALRALAAASARAQIDSLETLLEDDRSNLKLVQDSLAAGAATRVDELNAQSQLANDQTQLPALRRQLSGAEHALALLVGHAPAEWTAPAFKLEQFQVTQTLSPALPSELAHRRPDILAAEAQLHAATAAVGVASANLYPQIGITGSASMQANTLHAMFDASSAAAGLTGNLVQPLFDHGALRAKQRAAVDAMHAALDDYQSVVLQAFGQVADLLDALDHDQELLDSEQTAVGIAGDNLKLTRESYTAGNTGVLQVLDAERQDQQARLGQVRAQAQRDQDMIQLLLALGGRLPDQAAR